MRNIKTGLYQGILDRCYRGLMNTPEHGGFADAYDMCESITAVCKLTLADKYDTYATADGWAESFHYDVIEAAYWALNDFHPKDPGTFHRSHHAWNLCNKLFTPGCLSECPEPESFCEDIYNSMREIIATEK